MRISYVSAREKTPPTLCSRSVGRSVLRPLSLSNAAMNHSLRFLILKEEIRSLTAPTLWLAEQHCVALAVRLRNPRRSLPRSLAFEHRLGINRAMLTSKLRVSSLSSSRGDLRTGIRSGSPAERILQRETIAFEDGFKRVYENPRLLADPHGEYVTMDGYPRLGSSVKRSTHKSQRCKRSTLITYCDC